MKGGRLQHQQNWAASFPATCRKLQTDFPGIFTNHFTQKQPQQEEEHNMKSTTSILSRRVSPSSFPGPRCVRCFATSRMAAFPNGIPHRGRLSKIIRDSIRVHTPLHVTSHR